MMLRMAILALFALAACGVDGDPQPPVKSGLAVSGDARVGITGTL